MQFVMSSLQCARKARGITVKTVNQATGICPTTIYLMESGKLIGPAQARSILAKFYNGTESDFFADDGRTIMITFAPTKNKKSDVMPTMTTPKNNRHTAREKRDDVARPCVGVA